MNPERWSRLMMSIGLSENTDTYVKLMESYSGNGRFYHNCDHISSCLGYLEKVRSGIDHPDEVEMAIWFHDSVYKPLSSENEKKSAQWAVNFLQMNGADSAKARRVESLILCTIHGTPVHTPDESCLVDIDLSILGAERDDFQKYEQNIRKEYSIVPDLIFKPKRKAILREFLSRARIYSTEYFHESLEQRARKNLADAIEKL